MPLLPRGYSDMTARPVSGLTARSRRRASMKLAAVLAIGALALAACGSSSSSGSSGSSGSSSSKSTSAAADTSLTIGINVDPLGLDPGFLEGGGTLVDNIFDTLVERNAATQLEPGLATSWKNVSPDVWQFDLRKGVKFTNGEPFNATAVQFTIERVLKAKNTSPTYSYISTIKDVKVVNPYEVDVVTSAPDPIIPSRFSRYPTEIVPPTYVKRVGNAYFSSHPIGTGPYEVTSFVKDEDVVMKANPDYWRGAPRIKNVTWKYIANGPTMSASLVSGQIQLADELPIDSVSQVQSSPSARVVVSKGTGFDAYIGLKTNQAPFNNIKVRQALNYAVNRSLLASAVEDGYAIPTLSLYRTEDFGYAGNPSGYPYDPAKAKQLLAEAGYPHGFTTTLDVTSAYANADDVGETIQQELKAVGIKITVNDINSNTYFEQVPEGKQAPMYMLVWGSSQTLDADSAIYPVLACGSDYSTYCNSRVQALLNQERSTINSATRKRDFAEIQQLVIQQAPRIFLYLQDDIYGLAKDLHWTPTADESIPVYDMYFS
jgi:peptide/nickel transport system substrate-binding protein